VLLTERKRRRRRI